MPPRKRKEDQADEDRRPVEDTAPADVSAAHAELVEGNDHDEVTDELLGDVPGNTDPGLSEPGTVAPPLRAAKHDPANDVAIPDDLVTEKADGEKIGRTPGEAPPDSPTAQFHYQQVILPVGDATSPGPDTAAITACLEAGYRPVAEASIDGVTDHPDGVSKVVTWRVPCVLAGRVTG